MTEERYEWCADGLDIWDNQKEERIDYDFPVELNKLHDENEQLKKENKELALQLEVFKDKLCELGVSDVKLYGKRYYTGLEEYLND